MKLNGGLHRAWTHISIKRHFWWRWQILWGVAFRGRRSKLICTFSREGFYSRRSSWHNSHAGEPGKGGHSRSPPSGSIFWCEPAGGEIRDGWFQGKLSHRKQLSLNLLQQDFSQTGNRQQHIDLRWDDLLYYSTYFQLFSSKTLTLTEFTWTEQVMEKRSTDKARHHCHVKCQKASDWKNLTLCWWRLSVGGSGKDKRAKGFHFSLIFFQVQKTMRLIHSVTVLKEQQVIKNLTEKKRWGVKSHQPQHSRLQLHQWDSNTR